MVDKKIKKPIKSPQYWQLWKHWCLQGVTSNCIIIFKFRRNVLNLGLKCKKKKASYVLSGWHTNCFLPLCPRGPRHDQWQHKVSQHPSQGWSNWCCWCCASCGCWSQICTRSVCIWQHWQWGSRIKWCCHCWETRKRLQWEAKLWKIKHASFEKWR